MLVEVIRFTMQEYVDCEIDFMFFSENIFEGYYICFKLYVFVDEMSVYCIRDFLGYVFKCVIFQLVGYIFFLENLNDCEVFLYVINIF